jgi:hypothetical protein
VVVVSTEPSPVTATLRLASAPLSRGAVGIDGLRIVGQSKDAAGHHGGVQDERQAHRQHLANAKDDPLPVL